MEESMTPEMLRELGKAELFDVLGDKEKRAAGLSKLLEASRKRDPEARFIIAKLLLEGCLGVKTADPESYALDLMYRSAEAGFPASRAYLNRYYDEKYKKSFPENEDAPKGPLVDFDGKKIKIKRRGLLTPVDAVLEYKDGKNILTLSVDISIVYIESIPDMALFEDAVMAGVMEWQGDYEVFGGQRISVRLNVTKNKNLLDNVSVIPMTKGLSKNMIGTLSSWGKTRTADIIRSKRSFAGIGIFRWSVKSRKIIYIQSEDGTFTDAQRIKDVMKHEFGHALGLGDLYESASDGYEGVEKGTYAELDCYYVSDRIYDTVMCSEGGPITNNDIEMVLLAFKDNKIQSYQRTNKKVKISKALGRGN